jgi:HK97 family phage portal protein
MGWWNRLRRKASVQQGPIVLNLMGVGLQGQAWWPSTRDYIRIARDGYEANTTVFRCVGVRMVANAGIPWCLYKRPISKGSKITKLLTLRTATTAIRQPWSKKAAAVAEIENHPLLTLIERPNPWQGQGAFVREKTAHKLISGNCYTEFVGPSDGLRPREMYTMRPDRMRVIPGQIEKVDGYVFQIGATIRKLLPQQVLHQKMFAALDDWYGFPALVAAAREVDTDNEALRWNYNLLKNDARPPGAFVLEKPISPTMLDKIVADIQKIYGGSANAGRPLVMTEGTEWIPLASTPHDMDWHAARRMSKLQIASALGVPPELTGDAENKTFANYKEARASFYQETVLPDMDEERDDLNNFLVPKFGDGLYLDYDRDQIEALQDNQVVLWQRTDAARELSINEKRALKGYDAVDGGDIILVDASMMPLSAVDADPQNADPGAKPDPEAAPA